MQRINKGLKQPLAWHPHSKTLSHDAVLYLTQHFLTFPVVLISCGTAFMGASQRQTVKWGCEHYQTVWSSFLHMRNSGGACHAPKE